VLFKDLPEDTNGYYEHIVDAVNAEPEESRGDMACTMLDLLPTTPKGIKSFEEDTNTPITKLQKYYISVIEKYGLRNVPEEEYRKILTSLKPTN